MNKVLSQEGIIIFSPIWAKAKNIERGLFLIPTNSTLGINYISD